MFSIYYIYLFSIAFNKCHAEGYNMRWNYTNSVFDYLVTTILIHIEVISYYIGMGGGLCNYLLSIKYYIIIYIAVI